MRSGDGLSRPHPHRRRRGERIALRSPRSCARTATRLETAADGFKALGKLDDFVPDVLLTDLKMPGLGGMALMEKAHERLPSLSVVVMTAFGTIPNAVEAVQKGAYDYLMKPLDFQVLARVVERAVERARLVQENSRLRDRLRDRNPSGLMLGKHPAMLALLRMCEQVAQSRATVLIRGDTGTGKELVADVIHRGSPRKDKALVRLNCAALTESLLESELFGHERGAFTGAVARRDGRFLQADGGTLFLDEVSEIPMPLQVKLLRVLQERAFERVGGNETLHVDVRIIAATNRDLRQRIGEGLFREDLYYRLNVVTLEIPRLRDRASDIPWSSRGSSSSASPTKREDASTASRTTRCLPSARTRGRATSVSSRMRSNARSSSVMRLRIEARSPAVVDRAEPRQRRRRTARHSRVRRSPSSSATQS